MADGIKIKLLGDKKVKRVMRALPVQTHEGAKRVINETALLVTNGAKKRCPVDTGRLRSSIRPKFFENGLAAEVGTNVHYSPYVEFGTRFQRAQPFLWPAWEAERLKFLLRLSAAVKQAAGTAK